MLTLLLMSMFTLAFNIHPVKADWTGTVYIRAGGSIDPPDAPIITYDNVTYILTGNITSSADGIVVERDNIVIDGEGYTIQGTGNYNGIDLSGRSNITIKNMKMTKFYYGIWLYWSSNNNISENKIENNVFGIKLPDSSNNIISGNNIINNGCGIMLVCSSSNNISRNNITNNGHGITLSCSSNNNISRNDIITNNYEGIWLASSLNNIIYHNNFIDNTDQVFSYASTNIWDDGYPSGGNYWSDYNGTDLFSGLYQNETGSDGIGDTPYVIDENNVDRYPLMRPWSPSINATVDVFPNVLNLRGRAKYFTAYMELQEGYNVSEIDVSSILLNNTIPVDLNAPIAIGDYDNDTIPDLMVKFNGTEVMSYILNNINVTKLVQERFLTVTLTLTGKLNGGTRFQGSDTIRIIMPILRGIGRHLFSI